MRISQFSIFYFPFFGLVILLSAFYFLFSHVLFAASIRVYFDAPPEVVVGQEFPVRLLVDSDQPLNAYAISLRFPEELFALANFNNGNSLINVWQNQPIVFVGGDVKFAGASFTPFNGNGGELLVVNFRAKDAGEARLTFKDAAVFLANGKGTKVVPRAEPAAIRIKKGEGGVVYRGLTDISAPIDKAPPEIKILSLDADPFNSERKLAGFVVADAASGIKEVSFRARKYIFWSDWQPARNPISVSSRVWSVEIMVSDNAGNVAERIVYDRGAFTWLIVKAAFIIGVVAAALVVLLRPF